MPPPTPVKATLTKDQTKVLFSILDVFIPELTGQELEDFVHKHSNGTNDQDIRDFAKAGIVNEHVAEKVLEKINNLPEDALNGLGSIFKILNTKVGTLAMGGVYSEFTTLSLQERTQIVNGWRTSLLPPIRGFVRAMQTLSLLTFYLTPSEKVNRATGYLGPDPEMNSDRFTAKDLPTYDFIQVPEQGLELTVDVVIVGSGSGGGVVAAELAQAGSRVLVVEKGHYYHPSELTLLQDESQKMYEGAGSCTTADGSVGILAGSTWGGGSTVNWSGSLELPYFVREEWANQGLPHFTSQAFQQSIDTVSQRLGVSDKHLKHNGTNSILLEGCRRLGYPVKNIPQNTGGHQHSCGWCAFGCRYGEKQGTAVSFLQDAKAHGAQFMQDTFIEKVLLHQGHAVGVMGYQEGRKVVVNAKKVIVSGGSIHSPALLMRSGLKNKNIGKHLHIHPGSYALGVFEQRTDPYVGSIMTAISTVAEDVDGTGHGAKLVVSTHHIGTNAITNKFTTASEHKSRMLDMNYVAPVVALGRDRDTGTIDLNPEGMPIINYSVSKYDCNNMTVALVRALKVLVAAGAKKVWTTQDGTDEFFVNHDLGINDPAFKVWIKTVKSKGLAGGTNFFASAHQMGTCRMGSNPKTSVVKPTGETWEVKGLYVADASTFPSASGVNPMLTTFSIAHSIAQCIKNADAQVPAKI